MANFRVYFGALIVGCLSSSIPIAGLYVLYSFDPQKSLIWSEKLFVLLVAFSLCMTLLFLVFRTYGWKIAKRIFRQEANALVMSELALQKKKTTDRAFEYISELTGVDNVFKNLQDALPEINKLLATANNISIFVQLGRDILHGKGHFFPILENNRSARSIRILHCSQNNPYLTEKHAIERGDRSSYSEWHREIGSVVANARQLTRALGNGRFETRVHNEGYLWRIFLFDDSVFVQPYIYPSQNSQKAPIFRIGTGSHSLFNTFKSYFEFKWRENEARLQRLSDLIPSGHRVAVTAMIRVESHYVFVIANRNVRDDRLLIQAPGGKVERMESYAIALKREIREEVGLDVVIRNSHYTLHLVDGISLDDLRLDGDAPAAVSRRSDPTDRRDSTLQWILVFACDLSASASFRDVRPGREVDSVVMLTTEQMKRCIESQLTVGDIRRDRENGHFISNSDHPDDLLIEPTGMVPIVNMLARKGGYR